MWVIVLAWLLRCSVAAKDGWGAMKGSFLGGGKQKSGVEVSQQKEFLRENQPSRWCSNDEMRGEQRKGMMDSLRYTSSETNIFVPEQNFLREPDHITTQKGHTHTLMSTRMQKFVDHRVRSGGFRDKWAWLIEWLAHSNELVWKLIVFMSLRLGKQGPVLNVTAPRGITTKWTSKHGED